MKKWVLSRRDSGDMLEKVQGYLHLQLDLPKSAQASCAEPAEGVVFVEFDGMTFVQTEGRFFPYLGSAKAVELFPSAVVDEGAIKFLLNGADVMRPGIRKLDDWGDAGRCVAVREEKKGRAIAVGWSTVSGGEAESMKKGSCLKNIHHVGDRFWELHKAL